jgi:hypothetical protein
MARKKAFICPITNGDSLPKSQEYFAKKPNSGIKGDDVKMG